MWNVRPTSSMKSLTVDPYLHLELAQEMLMRDEK